MRETRDPYSCWVAEVILQQTRMDQGLPYYLAFLESFPDVHSLASAPEDEVLRLWQGLGYYSRARHLQASARFVDEHLGGVMPGDYRSLLKLKGVGKYTAAAIASWCYNEPCAAVDGNVARVISRLFGIEEAINTSSGEKQVYALASELLDRSDPGGHNQAMIDFGAMQCVPVRPDCDDCPLKDGCEAFRQGKTDRIPVKIRNKKPVERWFYYYMLRTGTETVLVRRGNEDIWAGLYEFPMIESGGPLTEEEILQEGIQRSGLPAFMQDGKRGRLSAYFRHQLSHRTIHARFLQLELDRLPRTLPQEWHRVPLEKLPRYAMPRLIQRYLESVKN